MSFPEVGTPKSARKPAVQDAPFAASYWPITKVHEYSGNPRRNADSVGKVAASLKEYGWRQPIVVDEQGIILAGHTRLLAAIHLGMATVPVHVAKGLTAAQAKAYRLADNRAGQASVWDDALLALELSGLRLDGFDLSATGFDAKEIERLLDGNDPGENPGGVLGGVQYQVIVSCESETAQGALCEELESRGLSCRLLTL